MADDDSEEERRRKGTERLLGMWRSAVGALVEAARQHADNGPSTAADVDEDSQPVQPTQTWVFPIKPKVGTPS